jgi:xanthosine phosphorylase
LNSQSLLAVIAGSGMGGVVEGFEVARTVAFTDLDGVGECTVVGHRGEIAICDGVVIVLGRRHVYEGEPLAMRRLLRWVADQGANDLVVASAAGSLRSEVHPGEFVVCRDALDLQNRPPAAGTSARAPSRPYSAPRVDADLTGDVEAAVRRAGVAYSRGTLVCLSGPTYETPAEVEMLQRTGASVVTMSAAPEIVFARDCGMRVAVLAAVTNHATGIGHAAPDHGDVLSRAGELGRKLGRIVRELIATKRIA